MLTVLAQHLPKTGIDRSYVPRKQEGRGQMRLEEAYVAEVTKLMKYCRQQGRSTDTNY